MKIAEYIDIKISGITADIRALDTRLEKLEKTINAPKHLEYNEENETDKLCAPAYDNRREGPAKDLTELSGSSENERRKGDE